MERKVCCKRSEPSFFEGIGRLIDWGGTLNEYNNSQFGAEADYKALKSDWEAVGGDIRTVYSYLKND